MFSFSGIELLNRLVMYASIFLMFLLLLFVLFLAVQVQKEGL